MFVGKFLLLLFITIILIIILLLKESLLFNFIFLLPFLYIKLFKICIIIDIFENIIYKCWKWLINVILKYKITK